jgi:hypothetical protein
MSLAQINALTGDSLGMGNIDPMMSMAMGFDIGTAMLMSGQDRGMKSSCRSRCGVSASGSSGAAASGSYMMQGRRLLQDENFDDFFNDAGLAVDVDAETVDSLKEGVADADDRFLFLGEERKRNVMEQCGCDSLCSYYGNCCKDYYQVCN